MTYVARAILSLLVISLFGMSCSKPAEEAAAPDKADAHAGHDHDHADHAGHDHGTPAKTTASNDDGAEAPIPAGQFSKGSGAKPAPAAVDPHAGHDHAKNPHAHPAAGNPHASPDHFIVEVNGTKLGHGELDGMIQQMAGRQLQQIPEQMRGQFMQQMMPRLQQQAVDRFIAGTILSTEAERQKIEAPAEELNKMLEELRKQIPPQVKWEDALKQMGTTDAKLRDEMGKDIKIRSLLKKQTDALPKPSEAEMKAVYDKDPKRFAQTESAGARHILLKVDEKADAAAKEAKLKEITELRKKLLAGADFAEMAKAHSDCPSKAKGGDLGTFGRGDMVPPFADAVFKQELNKVGDVVETRFGYHLIDVTQRKEAKALPFAEAKEQIGTELTSQTENTAITAYIAQLREKAEIKYGAGHEPPAAPAPGPATTVPAAP